MATLIPQTDAGDPTANAYADVAFSDLALALHPEFATWTGLGAARGDWLIFASSYADQAFAWKGEPLLEDAGTLRFPRKCLYDLDGRLISGLPMDFKQGICEIAMALSLEPPFEDDEMSAISEAKVDVLQVKFSENLVKYPIPKTCIQRLTAYGSYRFGSRRLGKLA